MARIAYLDPGNVRGRTRELLAAAESLPAASDNMVRAMAGTAVLEGYLGLSTALARGSVAPAVAERIALTVSEHDRCEDGPPPHASMDPRADAALRFARAVLTGDGHVDPEELRAARAADLTDVELVEIVGHIALNLLTTYFSRAFAIDRGVHGPTHAPEAVPPASARRTR